jgi:uncharacterized protein YjgD (DUF1641 family)
MTQPATVDPTLTELNQKLDRLTTQVEFLTEQAHRQKRRQEEWDELKDDLIPIMNDLFRLSVQQLEEIEAHVQIEDILHLFKRLLRNTRNLERMLDQLESLMALWEDLQPMTRDVVLSLMEQKGYFTFAQGGLKMVDEIVANFDEEDVRLLSENIVLILRTIREMTQPEIMVMMRDSAHIIQEEEPEDSSLFTIVRQLNDPTVRRGLAKTLYILKKVGEQPPK